MPYSANDDLPTAIRRHLPRGAQTIYREAFNGAWRQYAASGRREEIAHRVAWTAVKKRFHKAGNQWAPIGIKPAAKARSRRRMRKIS